MLVKKTASTQSPLSLSAIHSVILNEPPPVKYDHAVAFIIKNGIILIVNNFL